MGKVGIGEEIGSSHPKFANKSVRATRIVT